MSGFRTIVQNIDWTTMFLIFWLFFGLFIYSVANILLIVKKKRQQNSEESKSSSRDNTYCSDSVTDKSEKSVVSDLLSEKDVKKWWKSRPASGPDQQCVKWVNSVVEWMFTQEESVTDSVLSVWLNALNDRHKKLTKDNGITIEFIRINRDQSYGPELSDIMVDKESNDNITIKSKIWSQSIKFLINAFKESDEWIQYELTIDKLEGMLKIICISEELLFVLRFIERPDFKASLKTLKSQQTKSENRISEDAIISSIVNTISSTVVDLCLSHQKHFPRLQRTNLGSTDSKSDGIQRKLLVKVVEANDLAKNKGTPDPYCVIEVDEPSQRSQTSSIRDTTHPVWNEHFIFDLKEGSSEILFEVYDKREDKFLGLGIVSVSELRNNPSQNQVLKLQPRPLESDNISGALAVEFLFMEHHSHNSQSYTTGSQHNEIILNKDESDGCNGVNSANEEVNDKDINDDKESIENKSNNCSALKDTNFISEMTSLIRQKPESVFSHNPFIQIKQTIESNDYSKHQINPFESEFRISKVKRSVSCDNIRAVPVIPPLIDLSMNLQINSSKNANPFELKPGFRGNPFDNLKIYRKSFYTLPTQSISAHLNQLVECNGTSKPIPLPPTSLFPHHISTERRKHLNSRSMSNINTNPFVSHKPRYSYMSSVVSVIGIESSDENSDDSSDNTITVHNVIDSANEDSIRDKSVVIDFENNTKFTKNKKNEKSFRIFNKKLSLKQNNKRKSDQVDNKKKFDNRENRIQGIVNSGEGVVELHASYTNHNFVNQNELEFCLSESPNTEVNANKSCLTIHSNQRVASENGGSEGYGTDRGTPDISSVKDDSLVSSSSSVGRSRPKEPKSLLKAIKKRFSFSNRSKSVEIRTNKNQDNGSRDSSVSSSSSRARSMPGSREPSAPKDIVNMSLNSKKSKTDSYGNISEISGVSNKTFVHPKSTLIVETKEDGLKHYVVPMSLANKSKWRRKGVKLHSFNDHLFVAKHLSGSITCQVCGKLFSKRPGKQGYQCRDCDYMCHKRCHIQVDIRCTKSTICSLKLQYVIDPKDQKNVTAIQVNDKPMADT